MIRRLLVPLDQSPYSYAAIEQAIALALRHDAEVTGLVVLDSPGIEHSIGSVPIGGLAYARDLVHERSEKVRHVIEDLLERFRRRCEKAGIRHREAEVQGGPSDLIPKAARYHDLVVAGMRTYYDFADAGGSGRPITDTLQRMVTPLLAVPREGLDVADARRVLLAYDATELSARALRALGFLFDGAPLEVTIISSGGDRDLIDLYQRSARLFLEAHGIRSIRTETTDRGIRNVIDEMYYDGAEMIALGAHSKKPVIDFMVGSLARHLVSRGEKALLFGA